VTIDEASAEIQRLVSDTDAAFWGGGILAVLARLQAHRDERFRRIRELERNANSARWSEARAKSGFGAKQARERAARYERAIQAIEVELGIRKGGSE